MSKNLSCEGRKKQAGRKTLVAGLWSQVAVGGWPYKFTQAALVTCNLRALLAPDRHHRIHFRGNGCRNDARQNTYKNANANRKRQNTKRNINREAKRG